MDEREITEFILVPIKEQRKIKEALNLFGELKENKDEIEIYRLGDLLEGDIEIVDIRYKKTPHFSSIQDTNQICQLTYFTPDPQKEHTKNQPTAIATYQTRRILTFQDYRGSPLFLDVLSSKHSVAAMRCAPWDYSDLEKTILIQEKEIVRKTKQIKKKFGFKQIPYCSLFKDCQKELLNLFR